MSVEQENALGRDFLAAVAREYDLVEDPRTNARLRSMLDRLLAAAPGAPPLEYSVAVVESEEVNAFAGPGGHIFLTSGLLDFARSDDEVAGVVAHELAHALRRHVAIQIRNQLLAQLGLDILSLTLERGSETTARRTMAAASLVAELSMRGYSRRDEREADLTAVDLCRHAGYDPWEMVSFLDRLWKEKEGGRPTILPFLSTHPGTPERIAYISARIREVEYGQPVRTL